MRKIKKEKIVSYQNQLLILALFPILSLVTALVFGGSSLTEFYIKILKHPGILITDYMEIGDLYSALFNLAMVSFTNLFIIYRLKLPINGLIFAAYFVSMGFSTFGKTPLNILPIYFGGLLYCRHEKINFKNIFGIMMFSSGMAPLVSFLMFNTNIDTHYAFLIAIAAGICTGFVMPPLSSHMLKFHEGYNLYNVGFTGGILGNIFASLLRGRGIEIDSQYNLSYAYDMEIKILLTFAFCIYIFIGYYINRNTFNGYDSLVTTGGRLLSDYILTEGLGLSLMNAGILGLLSLGLVSFLNTPLNGALIAGIFTVFGFGAFGKHPINCIPVVLGVLLASMFKVWEYDSFNVALSALFATTLAPVAGVFGPVMGLFAGFLHLFVVNNVGYLHGGINLYNNGFSGGMIGGVLIPIIHKFKLGEKFR